MGEFSCDVVVVGAGNAGLAAAVSAKENGAGSVVVLEKAPLEMRGGDTYYAGGGIRFAFEESRELDEILLGPHKLPPELRDRVTPYTRADFFRDLMSVSNGRADKEMVDLVVSQSKDTVRWMASVAQIEMQLSAGLSADGGANAMKGGSIVQVAGSGPGLSQQWFDAAQRMGIQVLYEAAAIELLRDAAGRVSGVAVRTGDGFQNVRARNVILAAGGFAANAQMRAQHLGPLMAAAVVRGTPYNQGDALRMALAIGAMPAGQWNGYHATPVSADWADFTPRDVLHSSRRASYIYSLMLNRDGVRFVDEGADTALLTYASITQSILAQPGGTAWQIFDSKVSHLLGTAYESSRPIVANTLEDLLNQLDIPNKAQAVRTITEFNHAAKNPEDGFDPNRKDGTSTSGLTPNKSNWALKIDRPPFHAYSIAGGITWTYGGLKVNADAQVIGTDWRPIPGLYCCGEMVGGLFYANFPSGRGYPAGAGFVSGATFGRIAGRTAAKT